MELKLEQFIRNVGLLTNIHKQNKNPIMFRMPLEGSQLGLVFYCSYSRPRYVVLPINAIWIDYNPESATYGTAFKRTVKDVANPYNDVWTALYFYDEAVEEQTYDPKDLLVINKSLPPLATYLTRGVGYLSTPEAESRIILEGDPTLTDDREPKEHTHPEVPATMISVNGSFGSDFIPIRDQLVPQISQILVLDDGALQWRKLKEAELATSDDDEEPVFPEPGYNSFIIKPKPITVELGVPFTVELAVYRRDNDKKVIPRSFSVRVVNNPDLIVVSDPENPFLVTITANTNFSNQVFVCDYWFYQNSSNAEQVRVLVS